MEADIRASGAKREKGRLALAAGPANLKTWNGLAKASIKTMNGLAIGSVKSVDGLV